MKTISQHFAEMPSISA